MARADLFLLFGVVVALAGLAALDHVARDARRVAAAPQGGLARALRSTDGHRDAESHGEGGTDDDDRHSAESETETSSGEGGKDDDETDFYGKNGWNLKEDFVSRALRPQELQPYYLMPLFFGIKVTMTISIFGFGIKFKKDVSSDIVKMMKQGMKVMFQLGFVAMACNCYLHDFQLYTDATKDMDGFWKKMCILAVSVATSGNYVAARALRAQVTYENPVTLLQLTPNYTNIQGLPLMPGGAQWLRLEKHLYFLLLCPYLIFYTVSVIGVYASYLGLICYSKCAMCCSLCTVSWNCYWSLLGTIVTFGLWTWARESLGYWWPLMSPLFYFSLMQIWATVIAPLITSVLYGLVNGISPQQLAKGLQEQHLADPDDIQKLIILNKDTLEGDFINYAPVGNDTNEDDSLDDTKLKIVRGTMMEMSSICLEQMLLIAFVRILFFSGGYDVEGYTGAIQLTLSERHWYTYYGHLAKLAEKGRVHAMNAIWMLV